MKTNTDNSITSYNLDKTNKKQVICYLLREFYKVGWCAGSGGGISIKQSDNSFWIAPSGVQKELVREDDLILIDQDSKILQEAITPNLRLSECTPLFMQAYKLRNAGAVLHSHSINALMVTKLFDNEFQTIDHEMIKGFKDHSNTEFCIVPIIENTERECELTDSLRNAINAYPRSNAVLVRNHGLYCWGESWEKAKIHVECYDYLFKVALEMNLHKFNIQRTLTADKKIRAWKIDTSKINVEKNSPYSPLQHKLTKWVSLEDLNDVKMEVFKLSGNIEDSTLERLCKERKYSNRDFKDINPSLSNYKELLEMFQTEHIHDDEEIRYVLEGSGYFDIRDINDELVRVQVTKGDLLVLPEGIYHRYIPDESHSIKVMRLFKDLPKWTAIPRPCNESEIRANYLKSLDKMDSVLKERLLEEIKMK